MSTSKGCRERRRVDVYAKRRREWELNLRTERWRMAAGHRREAEGRLTCDAVSYTDAHML